MFSALTMWRLESPLADARFLSPRKIMSEQIFTRHKGEAVYQWTGDSSLLAIQPALTLKLSKTGFLK